MENDTSPIFSAVTTTARQLYLLLRCISFTPKAEVTITSDGIRFCAEEARVIQGLAFLEKGLFSSYVFNSHITRSQDDDSSPEISSIPSFQINLSALLETLQIFGLSDQSSTRNSNNSAFTSSYANAFNTPALALGGTCRISYAHLGAPLTITISEAGVTTTCDLTTYEPSSDYPNESGHDTSIPLDRNALTLKIIMRTTWLHDAISELSNTNPIILVLNASNSALPYFALEGLGGPFGDSFVEFNPSSSGSSSTTTEPTRLLSSTRSKKNPLVTETFSVVPPAGSHGRVKQRYKFDLVKKAARAMALASKVSIRGDRQGVLSLQFMIELGGNGGVRGSARDAGGAAAAAGVLGSAGFAGQVSFVDFRFVPLVDDEDEDQDGEEVGEMSEE